jgi:hypothetical protein
MINNDNLKNAKNAPKYFCEKCDFICFKKSNYDIHCLTRKHLNDNNNGINDNNDNKLYTCKCGKSYKYASGLSRHKANDNCLNKEIDNKKINNNIIDILKQDDISITDSKIVLELLKQNNEFKELIMTQTNQMLNQMIEIAKNTNSIINNNNNIVNGNVNNNTQNTHFNIQMFLNETCKNAMTIQDFVESLKPTLHDLEETGRLGYSEGISRIIINGLKELDVTKRPIHCSDLKRETMFIKNTESWEKETEEKPILLKAIKDIGKKNIMNIKEWQKNNTHFNHYDSKQNDAYLQIVSNSMSGGTIEEQQSNYEKIVRNIAKETIINKK